MASQGAVVAGTPAQSLLASRQGLVRLELAFNLLATTTINLTLVNNRTCSSLTYKGRRVVAESQPASSALTLNPIQLLVEANTSIGLVDEDTAMSSKKVGATMPLVMQDWSMPKTKATSILRDSLTEMTRMYRLVDALYHLPRATLWGVLLALLLVFRAGFGRMQQPVGSRIIIRALYSCPDARGLTSGGLSLISGHPSDPSLLSDAKEADEMALIHGGGLRQFGHHSSVYAAVEDHCIRIS